jgi:hypothetical protein
MQIDAVASDQGPPAVREGDHSQIDAALEEVRVALTNLSQQRAPHIPGPDDRERKRPSSLEHRRMDDVERVTPLCGVDDACDMALRGPSSDRRDGDVMLAERARERPDDVGLSLRVCANESDDRLIALPTEGRRTLPKLGTEFTTNRMCGRGSLAAVHR